MGEYNFQHRTFCNFIGKYRAFRTPDNSQPVFHLKICTHTVSSLMSENKNPIGRPARRYLSIACLVLLLFVFSPAGSRPAFGQAKELFSPASPNAILLDPTFGSHGKVNTS